MELQNFFVYDLDIFFIKTDSSFSEAYNLFVSRIVNVEDIKKIKTNILKVIFLNLSFIIHWVKY